MTLFIYGSLLPGLSNHGLLAGRMLAMTPGRVAGRLVDVGPYPALVRDAAAAEKGSKARGLWIDVELKFLPMLDELEDFAGLEEPNDYDRVWTADADDPAKCGWVYVWPDDRGKPAVDGEDWARYFDEKRR
ncbi:gamma-glutamylcyclotransferase family protein [Paenibacillus xanthanilyticus]|uniref:Gamma-glutamylcyclotransferase n=1 Tax=Paenibacillus xanthanilyticus TaxID=1783531 RepID=A0ABV8K0F7_9BACL